MELHETTNPVIKKNSYINKYDISGLELYLHEMRQKGLGIKELGAVFTFEQCEPKNMEYRIEPMMKHYETEEEFTKSEPCLTYVNEGYTYLGTYHNMFLVFAKEQALLEVPAEKVCKCNQDLTQSYTYRKLKRRRLYLLIPAIILFLDILLRFLGESLFTYELTTFDLIRSNRILVVVLWCILLISFFVSWCTSWIHIRDIFRYCESRRMIRTSQKKKNLLPMINCYLGLVVVIATYLLLYVGVKPSDTKVKRILPYLRLKQIELGIADDSNLSAGHQPIQTDGYFMDFNSYYDTSSSFLVPVQIKVNENGHPGNVSYTEFITSIYAEYYELRFEYLVDSFFTQMLQSKITSLIRSNSFNDQLDVSEKNVTCQQLNSKRGEFYLVTSGKVQYLVGHRGKKVLCIYYSGARQLTDEPETYEELLQ